MSEIQQSNTENVKLGPCKITYDGVDLGYTKGGVEVTVETSTYEVVEGFPCITSEMLATGVGKVRYEIEISECKKYLINSTNNI